MQTANQTLQNLFAQVQSLLSHFDAQERALLAFKSLLIDIGRSDDDETNRRKLRQRIDAAGELCTRLRNDCNLIIQQLSATLGHPAGDITARQLIALLQPLRPELADSLRMARRRLLRLTWQIQRISGSTAWVLSEQQSIRKSVFEFAGGVSDSERYNAAGRKQIAPESFRYGARS